ncbi:hypothetical protein V6N13_021778 [Hibiscus sabdariffa]
MFSKDFENSRVIQCLFLTSFLVVSVIVDGGSAKKMVHNGSRALMCNELVAHGALVGQTPAEVVHKCKITIAMLSDPAAALSVDTNSGAVVFDEDGVLEQNCSR